MEKNIKNSALKNYKEVRIDGKHTFTFTDGIYGFSVRLDMAGKGRPKKIEVQNLGSVHPADGTDTKKENVAQKGAA